MLVLSVIFGLAPLAGLAWMMLYGSVTSVDGLFMSLILLALSSALFLNVAHEAHRRFHRKKATRTLKSS